MNRSTLLVATLLLATHLPGCASLFTSGSAPTEATHESKTPPSQPLLEKTATGIEVTWEVPSEPVDGFVIRYGEDRAQMAKEATILLSELRQERDEQYGPVYRYVIRDIASESPIYVSVAAFKGDVISDFSEAIAEGPQGS